MKVYRTDFLVPSVTFKHAVLLGFGKRNSTVAALKAAQKKPAKVKMIRTKN